MAFSNYHKGYLFAFLATISLSNVYIFSKAALNEVHLIQFGLYWFGFAMLWNLMYASVSQRITVVSKLRKKQFKSLLGIGIIEVIATVSFFIAIDRIPNPSIPSFLRNLEPIFIVLLGTTFLKEKFRRVEKIGIYLTIIGAFILSYKKNRFIE